jgi:hypothetical protein
MYEIYLDVERPFNVWRILLHLSLASKTAMKPTLSMKILLCEVNSHNDLKCLNRITTVMAIDFSPLVIPQEENCSEDHNSSQAQEHHLS